MRSRFRSGRMRSPAAQQFEIDSNESNVVKLDCGSRRRPRIHEKNAYPGSAIHQDACRLRQAQESVQAHSVRQNCQEAVQSARARRGSQGVRQAQEVEEAHRLHTRGPQEVLTTAFDAARPVLRANRVPTATSSRSSCVSVSGVTAHRGTSVSIACDRSHTARGRSWAILALPYVEVCAGGVDGNVVAVKKRDDRLAGLGSGSHEGQRGRTCAT